MVKHHLAVRDRIHEGPFYTVLNDGMKNGLKRKANEPAPTEASLFDPFTGNQTYSAKYLKVRRRLPKLDARPYGELYRVCWTWTAHKSLYLQLSISFPQSYDPH
jgi:hypothetical protein